MNYLYDGSFDGLLTCIYWNYYGEKISGIYNVNQYQQSIIENYKIIKTDEKLAEKVYSAIELKISKQALDYVYYCFLSNNLNKENYILDFVKIGFKLGKNTLDYYSHDKIMPIHEIYKKVSFERHRFLGLLRFSDIKGILYAKYSPDHNISVLVADHFADRLKNEKFIIHDIKRNLAVVYSDSSWYLTDFKLKQSIEYSEKEKLFQRLWQGYFNQLSIKERKNINLQFQFVPARYRKNLVEFNYTVDSLQNI